MPRRHQIVQNPETVDAPQSSSAVRTTNDSSVDVMWLRDLLPQSLPNARIATYSYESDWRQDVKTNLRECGLQLLNVLYQHRSSEKVSIFIFAGRFLYLLIYDAGSSTTVDTHWA